MLSSLSKLISFKNSNDSKKRTNNSSSDNADVNKFENISKIEVYSSQEEKRVDENESLDIFLRYLIFLSSGDGLSDIVRVGVLAVTEVDATEEPHGPVDGRSLGGKL